MREVTPRRAGSLAKLMFGDRTSDVDINLQCFNLRGSRDLFLFLLNLFVKGIVIRFSHAIRSPVDRRGLFVQDVTAAQFEEIRKRMLAAGIVLMKTTVVDDSVVGVSTDIPAMNATPPPAALEDYRLVVKCRGEVHTIWFALTHARSGTVRSCHGRAWRVSH
eukprot:jgi/Tetstr1/465023/TSEL_009751.t1